MKINNLKWILAGACVLLVTPVSKASGLAVATAGVERFDGTSPMPKPIPMGPGPLAFDGTSPMPKPIPMGPGPKQN